MEKPAFIVPPEAQAIHDFQPAITKVVVHGVPAPALQWLKDGKPIDLEAVDKLTQQKVYLAKSTNATTDQVEGTLEIPKFKENVAGTVRPLIYKQ